MFTFFGGKNSYLLQSIIKFGNNGFVDDFSLVECMLFLDYYDKVITPPIDHTIHPYSNKKILGFNVPLFKK